MASPLASIFSMLDSLKRNLTSRGIAGTAERTVQDLQSFGKLQEKAVAGDSAAQKAVTDKWIEQVLNFNPVGITLYHGGPQAISKVLPEKLGATGQVKGPGFYAADLLNVPKTFATRASTPQSPGVISAFDFPDELYAKMLQISDAPISESGLGKSSQLLELLTKNTESAPLIRKAIKETLSDDRAAGGVKSANDVLTGELINWVLDGAYGKNAAAAILENTGIPGKVWQYSHRTPDTAAVIFRKYLDELKPVGNVQVIGPESEYVQRLFEQVLSKGATL